MTQVTQKLSFAELNAKVAADKNNSDLENLAHAMMSLNAGREALAAFVAERTFVIENLEDEINILASQIESGMISPVSKVHELYEKARKMSYAL